MSLQRLANAVAHRVGSHSVLAAFLEAPSCVMDDGTNRWPGDVSGDGAVYALGALAVIARSRELQFMRVHFLIHETFERPGASGERIRDTWYAASHAFGCGLAWAAVASVHHG